MPTNDNLGEDTPIDALGLTNYAVRALKQAGYGTVRDILFVDAAELATSWHIGPRTIEQLATTLTPYGWMP